MNKTKGCLIANFATVPEKVIKIPEVITKVTPVITIIWGKMLQTAIMVLLAA
uniref:Uncharacterized protein n=1 Tax=Klebsiella pneumoniae TaxID=573 RepID=A0A6G9HP23_KLEPN|nr:hypothetical protein [Klebsiella pneumoniae]QIQ12491.1 hypothetical protein [Klebsiella pneumoniae]